MAEEKNTDNFPLVLSNLINTAGGGGSAYQLYL